MSDDMVERVAKAVADAIYPGDGVDPKDVARSALKAMRVPTQKMLNAGPVEPYMDRDVWAAMIDAALGEKTGTHE